MFNLFNKEAVNEHRTHMLTIDATLQEQKRQLETLQETQITILENIQNLSFIMTSVHKNQQSVAGTHKSFVRELEQTQMLLNERIKELSGAINKRTKTDNQPSLPLNTKKIKK
jgi:hypothetical protein